MCSRANFSTCGTCGKNICGNCVAHHFNKKHGKYTITKTDYSGIPNVTMPRLF